MLLLKRLSDAQSRRRPDSRRHPQRGRGPSRISGPVAGIGHRAVARYGRGPAGRRCTAGIRRLWNAAARRPTPASGGFGFTDAMNGAEPLLLGEVITQIGHTGGATGMVSMIKAIEELDHREVPATAGLAYGCTCHQRGGFHRQPGSLRLRPLHRRPTTGACWERSRPPIGA